MFLQNVSVAATQVIILYLIAAVGLIADKLGLFTEKTAKACTDLLFYIITPAKIIESFITLEYSRDTLKKLFIAIGCGMILHTVSSVISALSFNRCEAEKACICKYAMAFGNCGYMALPLANAVLGSEGVFYCSAVIISFQVFSFTYGIYAMNFGKKEGRVKVDFKRLFLNPGVISVIIGLPLFLMPFALPKVVSTPITYIASMNSPLAMLIFGTYISNTKFSDIFKEWRTPVVCAVKLVVLPLTMLCLFKLIGLNGVLLSSLVMSASAPTANNTVMFAAKYDRDVGFASQMVTVVSLLSIVTMPLMIALAAGS